MNYSVSFNISQLPLSKQVLALDIGRCRLAPPVTMIIYEECYNYSKDLFQ
jgi:hypothetical protein